LLAVIFVLDDSQLREQDPHRDGKRLIVRADEKLIVFVTAEVAIQESQFSY